MAASTSVPVVDKGKRLTGPARTVVIDYLRKQYEKGSSVRALAEETGRSYGFVHQALVDAGVTLRSRGATTGGHRGDGIVPETRYYIGVTPEGWRLSLTIGPGRFTGPAQPTTLGAEVQIFPVSEAVLREWDGPVDTDDELGPDAMRWIPPTGPL